MEARWCVDIAIVETTTINFGLNIDDCRCKGLSAADADGIRPKGLTWDKSDSAVVDANSVETALRTERDADGAGERRKGQRERTDSDSD